MNSSTRCLMQVSGQRHALSTLLPVTLGPGIRELILVPVELC